MSLLTIAAVLFIITAILHVATLVLYGNTAATRPVAGFGIVYLTLGILLLATTSSWVPIVVLVLAGSIGAITQLKANPDMRNMNLLLIAIDLVVIILLGLALIG